MRTAKILTLVLALVMALTLVACSNGGTPSGGTSGGTTATPTPSPTQGGTISPSQDPTSDNGGDTTDPTPDNNTPAPSPDTTPGANNPLYDLPAGFETHPQDGEYFYATTDDYVVSVVRYTGTEANNQFQSGEYGNIVIEYEAYNVENGIPVDYFHKVVFENEDYANQYAASRQDYLAIGNIVYYAPEDKPPIQYGADGIQGIILSLEQKISLIGDGEVYVSNP